LLWLTPIQGFSQLINQPLNVGGNQPFLNAQLIKEMGIREMRGKIYTKRPSDLIRNTDGFVDYRFDSLGNTTYILSYVPHHPFKDSIAHIFQYDQNHVTYHRAERNTDYSIEQFEYANGKLINSEERIGLKRPQQEVITNSLVYDYLIQTNQELITISYRGGNKYQEVLLSYDSINRISSKQIKEYLTDLSQTTTYTYNATNQLEAIEYIDELGKITSTSIEYESSNEIRAIKTYTNGELTSEIQLIYSNNHLSSVLTLNHNTQLMEIIRFDY
jgi:antitoxin component YwqK of YwqJK toxin-antitoxin module